MKIGLALSGGGARGIAHLGVIKALNELNIQPNMIAGTSAGSIAGAMTAAGYSPDYVFEIIQSVGISNYLKLSFNLMGLFSLEKLEKILLEHIPHNSYQHLKIPLVVCATDIEKSEMVYFSEGELAKTIMASCCLPGIFSPIKFQDRLLVDGGIVNNLPIEPLESHCDFIIGVNVTPISNEMPIKTAKDVLMKSLFTAINKNSSEKLKQCDIAIEPHEIFRYDGLNLKKAKELYQLGYESALKSLEGKLSNVL